MVIPRVHNIYASVAWENSPLDIFVWKLFMVKYFYLLGSLTKIFSQLPKDQALEETVLTLFHSVVHGCFQPVDVTIKDKIACHNVMKG